MSIDQAGRESPQQLRGRQGGDFLPTVSELATGGVRIVFAHVEEV
ncbi:hypothetical protein [Modestobacter marinus]|nr:hypothetical protein [Modestobacter marinus]